MQYKQHNDSPKRDRSQHLIQEFEHDPYRVRGKLADGSACQQCGAVYIKGRWLWESEAAESKNARTTSCPACRRIQERVPAGELTLSGEFLAAHYDEIVNLIKNVEEREKNAHPLKRIMDIRQENDQVFITFTDPHLVRGVAEAINSAYSGELDYRYNEDEFFLRAAWSR